MQRFTAWIKAERHSSLGELMGTLTANYTGHWNYYGIVGDSKCLNEPGSQVNLFGAAYRPARA